MRKYWDNLDIFLDEGWVIALYEVPENYVKIGMNDMERMQYTNE